MSPSRPFVPFRISTDNPSTTQSQTSVPLSDGRRIRSEITFHKPFCLIFVLVNIHIGVLSVVFELAFHGHNFFSCLTQISFSPPRLRAYYCLLSADSTETSFIFKPSRNRAFTLDSIPSVEASGRLRIIRLRVKSCWICYINQLMFQMLTTPKPRLQYQVKSVLAVRIFAGTKLCFP